MTKDSTVLSHWHIELARKWQQLSAKDGTTFFNKKPIYCPEYKQKARTSCSKSQLHMSVNRCPHNHNRKNMQETWRRIHKTKTSRIMVEVTLNRTVSRGQKFSHTAKTVKAIKRKKSLTSLVRFREDGISTALPLPSPLPPSILQQLTKLFLPHPL